MLAMAIAGAVAGATESSTFLGEAAVASLPICQESGCERLLGRRLNACCHQDSHTQVRLDPTMAAVMTTIAA